VLTFVVSTDPFEAISQELFKDHQAGSLSSLDTDGLSRNALSMRIFMSTGRVIDTSYSISGPFTIQNKAVVAWLDGLAGQFAADLKAKEGDCELISEAALIGGYQFLLCSMVGVTEHAENFLDGSPIPSEYTGLNLEAHFKNIVVCRLRELMNKNLDAIRTENSDDEYRNSNAYAAAVTARTETHYFKSNIRNGSLRDNVPDHSKSYRLLRLILSGIGGSQGLSSSLVPIRRPRIDGSYS
jgi:hypothetical protein